MSMMETKYRYTTYEDVDWDGAWTLRLYDWKRQEFHEEDEFDMECLAEACASDYHSNHDGWEHRDWNNGSEELRFYIFLDRDTKVVYDVSLEYEPNFRASRAKHE